MIALPSLKQAITRENFSLLADIFSIVSFVISVLVLWSVRNLRNSFRFRARAPLLIKELSRAGTNLNRFLNEYDDSLPQVREEMIRAAVKLRSLRRNVNREQRRSIKRVLRYIDRCEVSVQNEEDVRVVYIEIIKSHRGVEGLSKGPEVGDIAMSTERNKWIDAVGKLITLTQERKLLWRSEPYNIMEADYAGRTLRLFTMNDDGNIFAKLQLQEPENGQIWDFPDSEAVEHLMEAARYQVVGVGEFLDELLSKPA